MLCFNCGLNLHSKESPECPACGVKLAIRCLACESPNPPLAKFCLNCGMRLSRDEIQSSVQNYDTLTENRKNVAVIFADVSGFTLLAEKLDPEEVRELINDCFSYITKPVYELEGTIDKYIGDCVMILFGAKYTHSDDVRRAVICALRMQELIRSFSEDRLSTRGFQLNLSIGINYGLVVTGSIGNYFDKDYTVMGDIVNTAQRLQSNAERGTVLVSESVHIETKDMVNYSKSMEIVAKNKENPIRCYIPYGLHAGYSMHNEVAFVGRDREMETLNSLYNSAINTGTRCVTVYGEAGIGKTRLLKEFISKTGSQVKKVWVDCSASSHRKAYFLLSHILMNVMNISPEDLPAARKHRLMSFVEYILNDMSEDDIQRNYDFLGLVLGFDRDHEFQNILNAMGFNDIRKELLKQLGVFFSSLCRRQRLIVVVDDVQWGDENSLNILNDLSTTLLDINMVLFLTGRYETEDIRNIRGSQQNMLKLEALGDKGTRSLLCRLLGCGKVDKSLLETVNRYTKGNPLFIREYASHMQRHGGCIIRQGIAYIENSVSDLLPGNIQSLILANLSSLDDDARTLLQVASVIGKEFSLSTAAALLDKDINLNESLKLPVQLNILSLKSVHTFSGEVERIFAFNHDIEREVIYNSILNRSKKEMHGKIGEYIEVRYMKDIENHYDVLCIHFARAGMEKKAAEYYYRSAVKYKGDFNLTASLEYYEKFLRVLEERGHAAADPRIVQAYRDIGHTYFITGSYDSALTYLAGAIEKASLTEDIYSAKIIMAGVYKEQGLYEEALQLLDEMEPRLQPEDTLFGKLLQMKCNILRIVGNTEALVLAKRSEKILLRTRDYHNLSETMNQAGILYFTRGEVENAVNYLTKALNYAQKVNNLAVMVRVSGNLGAIYHATGRISKARELFEKSIEISSKIFNRQGMISGNINLGILYMDKGTFNRAEELFHAALKISRETSSRLYECISLTNLGDVAYERGQGEKALEEYAQSLEIARELRLTVEEGVNYVGMARVRMSMGQYDEVPRLLQTAEEIFREAGEATYMSDCFRLQSVYAYSHGNIQGAMEYCDSAAATSEECKSDTKRLKAIRQKGSLLLETGRAEEAFRLIMESIRLAELLESEYEAAKGYYMLAQGYHKLFRQEEAERAMQKARDAAARIDGCRWKETIESGDSEKK
jgi:adenylate cyclase